MHNNDDIQRQIKNFKEIIKQGKKSKNKYFLGKTFSAKLFIKLCSKIVDTNIICLEILNFEKENRTKEDIETVLPWMNNLTYFYEYISMKETEESRREILKQLIWLLYRKIFYTAVTRAKKKLIILGEEKALEKAILTNRDEDRKTLLKNFLVEGINY